MAHAGASARKVDRGDDEATCPVRQISDGVWRIDGYAAARELLRSTDTVQAGLGVETVEHMPSRVRKPMLYRDGPEHREDRRQTARFFTPRRVDEHYRDLTARVADAQIALLRATGTADLADLTFHLAIQVTAEVLGLTESRPGLDRRLQRFFPDEFGTPGFTSLHGLKWVFRQVANWLRFHVADVRPALRARRTARRDDLISHLLDQGCTSGEILGECLTFAAAGMVTTREFIVAAAWHLFTDDDLRARYLAASEPERLSILHEILRLEPVIGRLVRRTTAAVEVPGPDGPVAVPAGALVQVQVSAANVDQDVVGDQPFALHPGREPADGGSPTALSFGDGPHKCPGSHLAMLEADVFLTRLFAVEGIRMASPPQVTLKDAIGGYELRGLTVTVSD